MKKCPICEDIVSPDGGKKEKIAALKRFGMEESMEQNLNLYHIFVTVARCKNISGAARALYISQPAISKAISRLEQSLNTTLFLRSSRGVKLTEAGEILYRQVENAFLAINQGEQQLKKMQELGMGRLSIGVSSTLCKYGLIPYLRTFARENPHIQISISCQSTYQTVQEMENGTVDIGLIGENDRMDKLAFYPLQEIEDIFVCTGSYLENLKERSGLSAAPGASSAREIIGASTMMLLDKGNITRQYIDKYLALEGITAAQSLEITSMDLLIEFARTGLGIACVIRSFVQDELETGKLICLPLPASIPTRRIGFAVPKNAPFSPALRKFTDSVLASV